ncbi:MAG: ATP-binding cassette domain-containing protein [Actinobacteria bacterium]|nr:ATP-binding cassette domain-containing protein [Actinomycetota bacterium]
MSLRPRTVVALVGESGSGKSTVARLLMGLYPADDGMILLDGVAVQPYARFGRRKYRRSVQMVFQDPFSSLNPLHSVEYHLKRPVLNYTHVGHRGLDNELKRLLETVQLTPPGLFLSRRPHELSGGQRQRVAVARALAARPRVLLADEPVSMLDVSVRLGLLNLLKELKETEGLALLYITHDIASARYFADEILVMYAGEIVELGPAELVTQDPLHPYAQLLLESVPDPRSRKREKVVSRPPSNLLSAPRSGSACAFVERCPYAELSCTNTRPALTDIGGGRSVRCLVVQRHGRVTWVNKPARAATTSGQQTTNQLHHEKGGIQ